LTQKAIIFEAAIEDIAERITDCVSKLLQQEVRYSVRARGGA